MGFLDGLVQNKAAKVGVKNAVARAMSRSYNAFGMGYANPTVNAWDLDQAVTLGMEKVIWVFRCVHVISAAQAGLEILLNEVGRTPNGKVIPDDNLYHLLNIRPNPIDNAWNFRYRLSAQLLLSVKGAFIEIVRSAADIPVEIYLLDPGTVEISVDPYKGVDHYEVTRGDGQVDDVDPKNIIHLLTYPHPTDRFSQVPPIVSARIPIETDWLARMFNRKFLQNDGRPGMIIAVNGDMTSEDAMEIQRNFSGGSSGAGRTQLIEAEGIEVIDTSAKPRDVQWNELIQDAKDVILLAFGCPESVLGNASGRCLRASELVHLADGQVKRAEELVGQKFELLQPASDGLRVVNASADYSDVEKIYKITTFSGRTLETNAEHPLFMGFSKGEGPFKRSIFPIGWTPMGDIKTHYERYDFAGSDTYPEVAVPIHFAQTSENEYNLKQSYDDGASMTVIPEYLWTAHEDVQKAFVSGLYTENGRLSQHTSFDIYPPSYDFAVKLQRLLVRIGVCSAITTKKMNHVVSISGKMNMFNFLQQVKLEGKAADKADSVQERLMSDHIREHNAFRYDGLPQGMVWDRILQVEEIGTDQTVAITVGSNKSVRDEHHYIGMFWEHNTYNNADSEVEGWWTGTVKQHCDSIANSLDALTNNFDDRYQLRFDYSTVDVMQRAIRRRNDEISQDFSRGAISMDEYLTAIGEEPIDVPASRVHYMQNGIIWGKNPEDVEAVRNLPVIGRGGALGVAGSDGVVGGSNDFAQAALAANGSNNATQTVNDIAARTLRSSRINGTTPSGANPSANIDVRDRVRSLVNKEYSVKQIDMSDPHRDIRNKMQGFLEGSIETWSNRQLSVIKDRMTHVKVRKGTRHWDGEDKSIDKNLDTSYIVTKDAWSLEIYEIIHSNIKTLLLKYAQENLSSLYDTKIISQEKYEDLNHHLPAIIDVIARNAATMVNDSSNKQSELVEKHIGVLDMSGKSIKEIQDTILSDTFDRSRWVILLSKKAVTYALESLQYKIYSSIDGKVFKYWCASPFEAGRESHISLQHKKHDINEPFYIDGKSYQFPSELDDHECINCSCYIYYGVDL